MSEGPGEVTGAALAGTWSELGIAWGETSKDGLFSLEAARCVGCCGLAPVVVINGDVHGEVDADQVPVILGKYLKKAKA